MTTVRIPLANDKGSFLIDEEDVPLVTQYRWHLMPAGVKSYAASAVTEEDGKQSNISVHRLILGALPGEYVDHRDGNGLNNTRANLRKATRQQNNMNRALGRNNTSGYKGVSLVKASGKWYAAIMNEGRTINLGTFDTKEDAARAYDTKARELFGDFARTNFPLGDEMSERTIAMRDLTAAEKANHQIPARSSTGIRNVFRHARSGRYEVRFSIAGVTCHCGYYGTLEEARDVAERVRPHIRD